MVKYMAFWEAETSKIPEDAKAKKAQWQGFDELVKKQLKEGVIKEWGMFAGEMQGYLIVEGSVVNLHTITATWVPFIKFTTKELMTIDEVIKTVKALPE